MGVSVHQHRVQLVSVGFHYRFIGQPSAGQQQGGFQSQEFGQSLFQVFMFGEVAAGCSRCSCGKARAGQAVLGRRQDLRVMSQSQQIGAREGEEILTAHPQGGGSGGVDAAQHDSGEDRGSIWVSFYDAGPVGLALECGSRDLLGQTARVTAIQQFPSDEQRVESPGVPAPDIPAGEIPMWGLLPTCLLGLGLGLLAWGARWWGVGPVPVLVAGALLAPALGARLGSRCQWGLHLTLASAGVLMFWVLDSRVNSWGAAGAWAGLLMLGRGLGAVLVGRCGGDVRSVAAAVFLGAALLSALPGGAGRVSSGAFSPQTTVWMLDLSPATLMVESAGIDWLRYPAVYGPAGGDAIGPDLRIPWNAWGWAPIPGGVLAGGVLSLVGYALTCLSRRLRRPFRSS